MDIQKEILWLFASFYWLNEIVASFLLSRAREFFSNCEYMQKMSHRLCGFMDFPV